MKMSYTQYTELECAFNISFCTSPQIEFDYNDLTWRIRIADSRTQFIYFSDYFMIEIDLSLSTKHAIRII